MKNQKICPTCDMARCFAYDKGKCELLTDNDFGERECPFYKTKAQVAKEKELYPNIHKED